MHRRHMANGRTRQERLTLFDREDIGPNSQAERERLERYVEELLRDRRRLELENAALRHSLAEGLPWVAFPADPAYPCTDCRDTIPYFYCDLCRAQWNKKQRELDELRGGPDFPATESEVGS